MAIARTEGPWLVTPDGRRILDAAGGAIVANVGHGRTEVADAVAEALKTETYLVPPFATPSRVRLVERLQASWLPEGLTRCVFTSGGSEGVDLALRVVRQHFVSAGEPSRWKVIGRELSYHGTTLATLSVGGHTKRRAGFEPLLVAHPKAPACFPLRCTYCGPSGCDGTGCADALDALIRREGPETVAAFIAEPVGGSTAGALVPPPAYWPRVVDICRRHGVLVIADEVMFYTYGAHPGACAAADKVLEILEREKLVERAAELGRLLTERLAPLARHPNVAEVRGLGLLQAVEFVRDRKTLEPFPKEARFASRITAAALGHGVFLYPGGCDPARDVVCFGPPFTIGPAEIDLAVGALEKALADVLARA